MSDAKTILADQHAAPTPGPLRIVPLLSTVDVYGPDAKAHAVATFWGPREGGPSAAEALANARAFAACNDLIAAAREVHQTLLPDAEAHAYLIGVLAAAIEKATGVEP